MSDAQPLRRPIVDPWAPDSTIPVQAGALTRQRPSINDPWRSAGQDPGPTANNAQPKSASPSLFRTAGDLARLGGGGIVTGTGRAIEGIERGIADNFRESKPGRVRFLDESGQPAPMTESQRERLRAWAERNPAYEPSRVSQSLKRTGESIQEGVSPSMKQAMADSEIDGEFLSPSTWTLGKDPSARGLLGHITQVGGEMAPIVAASAIPVVGPGAAVAAATGQSYSGAYEEAHDHVLNAPADELEKSPRYRELITAGLSEGDARKVLADEAGRGAAGVAAPIGGVSGAILGGVATKPLQNAIASRAGNTFGARLLGNLAEMPLEGLQEVAESVGGRYGANQAAGLDRDLTEGTFADFALGAAAGGPAAVVHSASSGTPRGDRDSGMTAQERAELIASDTPPAAALLALPPPGAITVDSEGNAMTPAQARERESLGLTPDVLRAQAQQEARQAVAFPDAAPGSLADAANALPQNTPTLADGSPLPDPAGGPLSRAVSDGVATGAIPTGATTWEQAQAAIALDAADTRQSAQREREMDAILRESRLPAALYDAEVARAAGVDEVARAPTAMELAMQRARSEAEAKSTRAAIVDPWAAPNTPESLGANLRFAENSTSYAPDDQSYAPQDPSLDPALITQSPDSITPVRFEPLGANGLLVYGDAAEIRARLAEVGFPKKGRNRDGALRFDAADRQALEAALMHGVDPARVPQGQARAEGSVGIPADVGSVQSITPNIAPAQAPAVGRLAAPITPPWMNSATGETSTPTTEQIRTAVEQQVAAQYRHNGSMPQPPRGPQPARIAMSDAERAKVMAEAETVDDDAPSFSRTGGTQGQASGNGLPVENVKRIARDFMRQYRGNIPLEVKVGRTLEELYGLNAGALGAAKGAYHPKSRVLALAADRLSSRADVESTIRHEALGHYGLNTLAPDDKRAVLDAILTSRNQRSLASVWAQVDALYADMPESVRAEEVFAELASRERGTLGEWWDKVLALLARGLRSVGLLRGDTSKAELHDLARRIAEGIRSGHAQQQTFPENDQSQFNRARGESAGKTPSGVGELSSEQLEVLRSLGLLSPEQEADLSGRGGETSDQPTNRWGERLIPEAEARAHLRDGTRGTADTVAGRAHVPVGTPGRAAGRAGEHLQLPDHAEEQPGPGARGDSDDGRATSRLLGVVRRLSESASDQLAGVPTATRHLDSRVGPFSGTETRARIKNQGTAQEALVVEVYGKEQIAAGLDEEPALAWTVNARTGELDVNGPNPDRGTFREFQKRGWADHARGQDGEIAVGWTALRNPDGSATLPMNQIIPMLADVHARYRALRKEDRVGLRWSRITGATGGPAGREASVFFSRVRMPKHLSEAQRDALSQIRSFATPESLPKRARRVLGELRRELVQGVFDQFQPIQALDETAYMQARLSRGTDGVLESLFLHGTPFLRDGAFDVEADGQGLRGVVSELQGEHDLFLSWIAGHRAAQLKEQGREHLFSVQQIDALKALSQGKMPDGSDRAAAYRKALAGYNRYQKAVLDIGQQAGLFSAEGRAKWESEFYIPFFRDFDAEQQNEPSPYREPGTQKVIQQLEGGRQPLGDLLTNVLENHSRILTASMRNMAADKALRAAEQAGMAAKVDTGSKDTHRVMRQGAPVHYQVADAPLVDALTMLHFNGESNKTMQVLGTFKRVLSFGVTISPGFRIRNLLRDTISAMSVADTADVTWNPLKQLVAGGKNVVRGWKAAERDSPMFQRLLAGGGAVRFGTLNDGAQSQYARRLIATGVNPDQILDTPTKLKRGVQAAFQWWQDVGDRGETVNRAVIYERAIQSGKNHLQASYEARDLIDFTAGGKWAAVRFLSQTVPFFNARLQGMYKLGRAAKGDFERFATVTGTVALASALLYLLQHDDEEYQALPDWARDAYWCINLGGTMLFIPKPFEVGALGSVVERGTELMVAGEDYQAQDFARSVTSIISDQLQMNPVPQAVRPLMEVAFNRDTFRGRPIDGMGQERLPAEDRYTARTSAAAVMAGRATNVSPQRIEHLVKGYFGWLGVQALNVADIATRPMTNLPSNPTRDMTSVSNWPVAGEFLRDASSVSSKYVERFYTMQQQNEELYAAFSAARAAGDIDRAMKLADTDAVQNRAFHNAAKRQMQEVGRSIRQVTADPSLSVRQKNELLTHFQAIRNQIAHQVDQITRAR